MIGQEYIPILELGPNMLNMTFAEIRCFKRKFVMKEEGLTYWKKYAAAKDVAS